MHIRFSLKRLLCLIMCCALLIGALPVMSRTAEAAGDGIIRVRISTASSVSRVVLLSRGNYSVEGDAARPFTSGQTATVYVEDGQLHITIGAQTYDMGSSFTLVRHAPDEVTNALSFSTPSLTRYFPGDMEFRLVSGKIETINHVFIEDYLRGVLAAEWSEGHAFESQKAMAIMARTKARRCMAAPRNANYDILNTSSDQNYKGIVPTQTNTARAVAETEGMVIRYKGSLIEGTYGASNGGQIEVSENWWGGSVRPYNVVKDDPYDYSNPKSPVKRLTVYADFDGNLAKTGMSALNSLLLDEVKDELNSALYSTADGTFAITAVTDVYPHTSRYPAPSRSYTKMRFVLTVSAQRVDTGAQETVTGVNVDLGIFSQLDTSTFGLSLQTAHCELFTVARDGANFVIEARRWGHGVGYSQYGGEQMAKEGYNWREILDFYNNSLVTYPVEKLARPRLTELGAAPQPTVTPKPTALPECELYPTPLKATVNVSSTLKLRVEPMSGASVLTTLRKGDTVAALGVIGDWSFIEYGDYVGYVSTRYLTMTSTPIATSDPGVTYAPTSAPLPTTTPIIVPDDGKYMQVLCATYANLRSGPSTSYTSLAQLDNGTLVKLLGLSGTWSHVQYGNLEGYISSGLLTAVVTQTAAPSPTVAPTSAPTVAPTAAPTAGERTARVTSSGLLNVRSAPSTGASKVGTLASGAKVTVLSEANGWACIRYGSGTAYVSAQYIAYESAPTTAPTAAPTSAPTAAPTGAPASGTATLVCGGAMNIRQLPTTDSTSLGTAPDGALLTVHSVGNGVEGDWACITYAGKTGYIKTKYLSFGASPAPTAAPTAAATPAPTSAPTQTPDAGYVPGVTDKGTVTASELNMRSQANTSATVVHRLSRGDEVEIIGSTADGKWYYVQYGAYEGYCSAQYILPFAGSNLLAADEGAPLFSDAAGESDPLRRLGDGEVVEVLEEQDSWALVRTLDGAQGYVQAELLNG